jgi:DNA-binding CsgD family transcriptional regulator
MTEQASLRALERRVLRLRDAGLGEDEIARRFRRSPEMIRRIVVLAGLPRPRPANPVHADPLRPLERRILRWRDHGSDYAAIGARFRRSAAHMERVEGFAHYKLSTRSLDS